jgi:NAD(P)-dependent dehydrogenase (short-subunit alcohol dehydrogenase family)
MPANAARLATSRHRVIVCPTGRPLDYKSVAAYHLMVDDAVAFVAPDQARWIIGQTLKVAGGTKFQIGIAYAGGLLT